MGLGVQAVSDKKIAFVVGHHERKQGAFSEVLKTHEWRYFKNLALTHLSDVGDVLFHNKEIKGYTNRQKEMADRTKDYKLVIELHFDMFNGSASGCHYIHYLGNNKTILLGDMICSDIERDMGIRFRGSRGAYNSKESGHGFIIEQKANAILLECFFGDSSDPQKFDGEKFRTIMQNIKGLL